MPAPFVSEPVPPKQHEPAGSETGEPVITCVVSRDYRC